jgi:hypothetical protein
MTEQPVAPGEVSGGQAIGRGEGDVDDEVRRQIRALIPGPG